jgi:hypothetical protein
MKNAFTYEEGGRKTDVMLQASHYVSNKGLFLELLDRESMEPFCNLTTNLPGGDVPPFSAFLDVNHLEGAREFVEKSGLAEDTGITRRSGFVTYPLYLFNAEALRELFPFEMERYERLQGMRCDRKTEPKRGI